MGRLILTGKYIFLSLDLQKKLNMIKSAFLFTESGKIIKMDLEIFSQVKMNSGLGTIIFMPFSVKVRFVYEFITLLFCSVIFSKHPLGDNVMKTDLTDWKGGKSYAMYDNFKVSDEKVLFFLVLTIVCAWKKFIWMKSQSRPSLLTSG